MKKLVLIHGFLLLLVGTPLLAAEPEQLYRQGLQAYNAEDYLSASEKLFAYRQMAGTDLSSEFQRQLDDALAYAENQVHVALQTKQELDAHGVVTKVTIESGGKADGQASVEKTVPFNPPRSPSGPRPTLPGNPPAGKGQPLSQIKTLKQRPSPGKQPERLDVNPKRNPSSIDSELESLRQKFDALVQELKRCEAADSRNRR